MKVEASPKYIHLKDYRQPDFWIQTADLKFDLREDFVRVHATLTIKRNHDPSSSKTAPLILDGEQLTLEKVIVNGRTLTPTEFEVSATHLTIPTFQTILFSKRSSQTSQPKIWRAKVSISPVLREQNFLHSMRS